MLEDTVSENGDQGSEAGNAGTDDGYIRLESRPDTEIDAFPFTKLSVITDYHVQVSSQSCDPRPRVYGKYSQVISVDFTSGTTMIQTILTIITLFPGEKLS